MRRLLFAAAAAALLSTSSASSALQPVRRPAGDRAVPRVRHGTLHIPAQHSAGRIRVLAALKLPPLASAYADRLSLDGDTSKLNVESAGSHDYLARIESAQAAAATSIRRAIPSAVVTRRFQVVLDALTVSLPARQLAVLAGLPSVSRLYPSLTYHLSLDTSPGLIGAPDFWAATGDRGEGMKIGIVDDGVDQSHVFFHSAGMTYPPGFPRGGTRWTTPKVIVARSFPGPGSGRRGRLALDRQASFHGTHVAGIAAGRSGTISVGGPDHPPIAGLSGVAPAAWIGNYRVFNVPTPLGYSADTPEIVAAFEAAVRDGMDVINFSGGGSATDPANDALVETVRNVVAAGVVPVIAAGNSRDELGLGSVASPGTAPDAITVAASSNSHVFAPSVSVLDSRAPATLADLPFRISTSRSDFRSWEARTQTLTDVGSIVGTDGRPVDRKLCGARDPDGLDSTLPPRSLSGELALVFRGRCAIVTKAYRAAVAGAVGMVLVDNRPGEPNHIPLALAAGMVADLDGARLRDFLASVGGRALVRFSFARRELSTGRSNMITSFSSAGPTSFEHLLKPDVTAPGGEILSSTLPEFAGAAFAAFDGTSMATPHVAGSAALLLQRHPVWTPLQVRSALVSTAGPAWGDTARTSEASVLLEGGGLVNVPRAADPKVFTDPTSLSFGDLNARGGAVHRSRLLELSDAGGGAGTWTVDVHPQSASAGAFVEVPSMVTVPPGGRAAIPVLATAGAGAAAGDDYGFVVLTRGAVARRVPYAFFVTRPGLQDATPIRLRRTQSGSTIGAGSQAITYRWPSAPFGEPPDYTGPTMVEDGAERVYSVPPLGHPVVNVGVSVVSATRGAGIDPWFLGSLDENDVQGEAGTPVNVNGLMPDYQYAVGAAGAVFPRPKSYYVAVDSSRNLQTGKSLPGRYVLRYWLNDLRPPSIRLLTRRVTAGHPTLAARVRDPGAGVDPYSVVLAYAGVLVGAALYDPTSGVAIFPLPDTAPPVLRGRTRAILGASDFQEAKNVETFGRSLLPNTRFRLARIRAVRGTTATWLLPQRGGCVRGSATLLVVAGSSRHIRRVRFFDGSRPIATDRSGVRGLFSATWRVRGKRRGHHRLRAVVVTRGARRVVAARPLRVCR